MNNVGYLGCDVNKFKEHIILIPESSMEISLACMEMGHFIFVVAVCITAIAISTKFGSQSSS